MLSRLRSFVPVVVVAIAALWAGCDQPRAGSSAPASPTATQSVTADSWSFRGTPNGWGTTALMGAILSYWLLAFGIATYRSAARLAPAETAVLQN